MHLYKRDYSSYHSLSTTYLWIFITALFIAAIITIIIKNTLKAALAKSARKIAVRDNNSSIRYDTQSIYHRQSLSNTANDLRRNQPQNPEDIIEPLPIYTPPNNSMNKPPNYCNN
jgi:hypothetical protein